MRLFSTLSRYICRNFTIAFLGVVAIFFFITSAVEFAEIERIYVGKGKINFLSGLNLAVLKAPYILEQVLPYLIFAAALFVFWRLNRNSEITIMRAIGMSIWQFIFPLVLLSLSFGALDLYVFSDFASEMADKRAKIQDKHKKRQKGGVKLTSSGLWLRESISPNHQVIYRVGRVDLLKNELYEVTLYNFENEDHFAGRVDAAKATLSDGKLTLHDVWSIQKYKQAGQSPSLEVPTTLTLESIKNTGVSNSMLSFLDLPAYIQLLEDSGLNSVDYSMYFHSMIGRAFWAGAMILLAAAFSLRPVRSGQTLVMLLMALLSSFALYFFRDFTYALGTSGVLSTEFAAALPPLLTALLGATLLLYQEDG